MGENAAVVPAVRHGSFSLAVGTFTPFSAIRLYMLMQTRGNGFTSRSIMSHRYDTLSKEYTGAKCWQVCEMNPCVHNNKISCPGTSRLNGKIWNKV